ncbi:MAG: MFS transporter [Alphaproteobacteria bacterium]|nr:MFS transporter [Alphaproteobacteria bacterium]
MTEATDLTFAARRSDDVRLVAGVSAAHFVSHFYMLVLPPLFAFVRGDYAVSYTEIGLALTMFNAVSAVAQTPAGFLIDRINARLALIAGLLFGAAGFAIAGLVDSYWVLIATFGLIGLGNTVYHPADYALLSRHVAPERMSQAYSVHTFAGMLGSAAAPGAVLVMHGIYGWRGAFFGAALLGALAALALVFTPGGDEVRHSSSKPAENTGPANWRLLMTAPILANFVFFLVYAFGSFGLQNFSVVALDQLHGTGPVTANSALSGYLLLSALGVLAGGWLAARTGRHRVIASFGLGATALVTLLIGSFDPGAVLLIVMMSLSGLCGGMVMPSRDMIVREVTPPGSFGKVFAFVTTGYHIAGILAPLAFGAMLDHGAPRSVFLMIAIFTLLSICAVACVPRRHA